MNIKWNQISKIGFPPEEKTIQGIGTGKSVSVLINFKKKNPNFPCAFMGHFFQVGIYNFKKSKWIMMIGSMDSPQLSFSEDNTQAISWALIIPTKDDRPMDNQKIEFTNLSGEHFNGMYIQSEDMFAHTYTEDDVSGWEYSWNILNWKPL